MSAHLFSNEYTDFLVVSWGVSCSCDRKNISRFGWIYSLVDGDSTVRFNFLQKRYSLILESHQPSPSGRKWRMNNRSLTLTRYHRLLTLHLSITPEMGQKPRTPPKCYDSSGISGAEQEVIKTSNYPECARSHCTQKDVNWFKWVFQPVWNGFKKTGGGRWKGKASGRHLNKQLLIPLTVPEPDGDLSSSNIYFCQKHFMPIKPNCNLVFYPFL